MSFVIALCMISQSMAATDDAMWDKIGRAESHLQRAIDGLRDEVMIFASDPVRGYHIPGKGIMLIVPVRYKAPDVGTVNLEFPGHGSPSRDRAMTKGELVSALHQWRQALSKKDAVREANFERVVSAVRDLVPGLLEVFGPLSDDEPLYIMVEEREPAWIYASFGSNTRSKRRIATLEISARMARQIEKGTQTTDGIRREDAKRWAYRVSGQQAEPKMP